MTNNKEELTDYSNEERKSILLFLHNDLDWYNNRHSKETEATSIIISCYLKERIKDCQEEI